MADAILLPQKQTFGSNFGYGLGSGLTSALSSLAENKLAQMQRAQQAAGLAQLLGQINPQVGAEQNLSLAKGLSLQPDILQKEYFKQILQAPQQAAFAQALSSVLGGTPATSDTAAQQGMQGVQPVSGLNLTGLKPEQALKIGELGLRKQAQEKKLEFEREKLQAKQAKDIEKFEKVKTIQEQREAQKETLPYYRKILAEYENAKTTDKRLDRMEALVKKGNLPSAQWYKVFNKLEESVHPGYAATAGGAIGGLLGTVLAPGAGTAAGIGLGSAIGTGLGTAFGALISPIATLTKYGLRGKTPDAEEFEKLTAEFTRGVREVFGSRISNFELENYLAMVPKLENTDAGKLQIIKNIKSANKAAELKFKAMKDIIKENNGMRPLDLEFQVEERIGDQLNKLAKDFVNQ